VEVSDAHLAVLVRLVDHHPSFRHDRARCVGGNVSETDPGAGQASLRLYLSRASEAGASRLESAQKAAASRRESVAVLDLLHASQQRLDPCHQVAAHHAARCLATAAQRRLPGVDHRQAGRV